MKFGRIIIVLFFAAALASCSIMRHVPEGEYLLKANEIRTDKKVPKKERITSDEISKYIQQSPNKKFFGINLRAWVYSWANPEKNNGWNRFLRRIGQEPVIFSLPETERSANNIKLYIQSRGFFNGNGTYEIDTLRHRKVKVIYRYEQGLPYRIGKITYDFRDEFLKGIILEDTASTLLHTGDIFDRNVFDKERQRIKSFLQNRGYYDFTVNNITFLADSTRGSRTIDVSVIVHQHLQSYNEDGSPVMANNTIYRVSDIYVYSDYNPSLGASDTTFLHSRDTIVYKGMNLIYGDKLRMRPSVLSQVVKIKPNSIYDAAKVNETYNDLIRLGYYKSANIQFTPIQQTGEENIITYVGDQLVDNSSSTSEGVLRCDILCTPALRQGYKLELEASTTSSFYGLRATVGYQNRNLFRGSELFDISLTAGCEFLRSSTKKTFYELGGSMSLTFPRFIFPGRLDTKPRVNSPQTKLSFSFNHQNRAYYKRNLSNFTWGYNWNNGKYSSYAVRPFDISLIKMGYINQEFLQSLKNPYLIDSYSPQLIAGISTSYVFNNQMRGINRNTTLVRLNLETTGNLLRGITELFAKPQNDNGRKYYNILGIRFAQYVRGDLSVSQKIVLGAEGRLALAYRLYGGAALSYGNSNTIPSDRLFFAGGGNSMRGWAPRTLGPGDTPEPKKSGVYYPSQLANMKLEANLEFRFPIWNIFNGALFFDAGNIWFLKRNESDNAPQAVFRFNNFYRQLGFDTGVGIRLDIKFAVLRLDWGIQLHNPNWPSGHRWIDKFKFKNTALNFGVGYPF